MEKRYASTGRIKNQLILAHDLEFISEESYEKLHSDVEEVKRMLASLLKTIRADR